jgi:hypothetical protein
MQVEQAEDKGMNNARYPGVEFTEFESSHLSHATNPTCHSFTRSQPIRVSTPWPIPFYS